LFIGEEIATFGKNQGLAGLHRCGAVIILLHLSIHHLHIFENKL
jgi:hypothetical protein